MADAIDDLFRRFGKAFNKADVEEIAACVTDDFEWRLNAGGSPGGAVLKGKEALRAHFADKSKAHREARFSEARIHRAGDKLTGNEGIERRTGGDIAPGKVAEDVKVHCRAGRQRGEGQRAGRGGHRLRIAIGGQVVLHRPEPEAASRIDTALIASVGGPIRFHLAKIRHDPGPKVEGAEAFAKSDDGPAAAP